MDTIKDAVEGVKNLAVGGGESSSAPPPASDKPTKASKKDKQKNKDTGMSSSGPAQPLEMTPPPAYIQHRIELFDKLKAEYDASVAEKERVDITITILPEKRILIAKAWEITPFKIAIQHEKDTGEKGYADKTVIAKVDGQVWDLGRPLEKDCELELLDFENPEGKRVFWHSSAHVLGEAAERRFGCHLCLGPPTDDGFFYEMGMPEQDGAVTLDDYKPLETIAGKIIKEKQPFERLVVSKEDLLEMFKDNKYKQHLIGSKVADGSATTVYRCGPLIDLCVGPHIPNTGRIKAFQIMKNSSSYFLGKAENDSLQRIYGVSFPDKKQMDEHKKYLEEAAARDHRKIGKEQELFFFHELSPGSCFFLPHGTRIYNTLMEFLRSEYWKRGYEEVITPNMYNSKLWEKSGHWQNYQENMFTFEVEKDKFGLKPMNCPGHCLLFAHRDRTYRELPWRVADFGVLHRNEFSGALTGLTRVRRFQQDDTHIFCTADQVQDEIAGLFDFLKKVYGLMGFSFKMNLSTRPEKYLGELKTWDFAEAQLTAALDKFKDDNGAAWELNPEDGAFYGPKIDITISDALRREYQCATIQLDFQLPERFELEYNTGTLGTKHEDVPAEIAKDSAPAADVKDAKDTKEVKGPKPPKDGYARPVMIHRAIYGSLERFIAILIEHFGGRWPFWISPRQILIVPVTPKVNDYCVEVAKIFHGAGFYADADIGANTMKKKILLGQEAKYNFIFVLGLQEMESRTLNIRNRDDQSTQHKGALISIEDGLSKLGLLKSERKLDQVGAI